MVREIEKVVDNNFFTVNKLCVINYENHIFLMFKHIELDSFYDVGIGDYYFFLGKLYQIMMFVFSGIW